MKERDLEITFYDHFSFRRHPFGLMYIETRDPVTKRLIEQKKRIEFDDIREFRLRLKKVADTLGRPETLVLQGGTLSLKFKKITEAPSSGGH